MRPDLPRGTVTFLFTDVEGSTKLLHSLGAEAYAGALAEHRRVIREACEAEDGVEVDTQGDAFFFAFPTAPGALAAAGAFTEALRSGPIQVRAGLHTGTPLLADEGYVGDDVHFAARVAASGHGGQIVLSRATADLVATHLTDLGEHRLKDIADAVPIYQLGDASFPPLKTISNTNLPRPASSFLGREAELAEVLSRIGAGARLVTLTGPGGTGKTRLALEAASTLVPEYKSGVFWVGLASLRDPALVTETISQTLGAKDGLVEHIGERELLLLLDNLEQVIEAAPELASLLERCPNLTLLVTSRELLRVTGEVEFPVPPLAEPEAVALFCERAQLEPSEEIAELCARLDSLPLAVELAAARTKALTTGQILDRLSQRLDLLRGGRDADPRQQTLRATIEWSYELLPPEERRLFARLSVFAGGCTLEAAAEVADADLDTLQSLVEKSLLRFADERYWMLETIREFAVERLSATPNPAAIARVHAEHYHALARAEPELAAAQADWFDRLDAEQDNLRAALDRSLEAGWAELGLRIAVALRSFWEARGHIQEAKQYLLRLNRLDQPPELRVLALRDLVFVTAALNELDETERYAEERRALCLSLGDEDGARRAVQNLGLVAEQRGDLDRARALYEAFLASSPNGSMDVGIALGNLARVAWMQGRLTEAEALTEAALSELEGGSDQTQVAYACTTLAGIRLFQDRREAALPVLARALRLNKNLRSPGALARDLETTALASTDPEIAGRLLGKADELREEIGASRGSWSVRFGPYARAVGVVGDALGQKGFDVAHREGRAMSLDDAIALAFAALD